MKRLQIYLLGPFQVTLDSVPLTGLRSNKTRALLAYLALHSGVAQQRESLAALLWGSSPEKAARASLRVSLSNLRRVLATLNTAPNSSSLLLITRQSVQFNATQPSSLPRPDCWVDVAEFDALLTAYQTHVHQYPAHSTECAPFRNGVPRLTRLVQLYRGDFLSGLNLKGSPAYDEWRLLLQERYHRQILAALDTLCTYHRALGHYEQVEQYAQRQIELEPWREESHQQVMWALASSGQRSAALAQFKTCRHTLQQELNLEPGAATVKLYHQIRDGALGQKAMGGTTTLVNPYKGLRSFQEQDAGDFFGRESLVARLQERLTSANTDTAGWWSSINFRPTMQAATRTGQKSFLPCGCE